MATYIDTGLGTRRHWINPGLSSTVTDGLIQSAPVSLVNGVRRVGIRSIYALPGTGTPVDAFVCISSTSAEGLSSDDLSTQGPPLVFFYKVGAEALFVDEESPLFMVIDDTTTLPILVAQYSLDAGATWVRFGDATSETITEALNIELEFI